MRKKDGGRERSLALGLERGAMVSDPVVEGSGISMLAGVTSGLMELSKSFAVSEPLARPAADGWPQVQAVEWAAPAETFAVLQASCDRSYVEQFRLLRTQLLLHRARTQTDYDFRCVTVMSSLAGEGKTFTAANLAATLAASSHQRVLLLETGGEARGFAAQFGMEPNPGLAQALAHPKEWMRSLRRLPELPLYLMPRGAAETGEPERVNLEPLPELLNSLRAHFEWIVLDGVSFGESADAPWISELADGNLLVVRGGQPTFGQVYDALRQIPAERLVGIVFNEREAVEVTGEPG